MIYNQMISQEKENEIRHRIEKLKGKIKLTKAGLAFSVPEDVDKEIKTLEWVLEPPEDVLDEYYAAQFEEDYENTN